MTPTSLEPGMDSWWRYAGLALVGIIFTAAGPLAIILAVAREAGLAEEDISSWIFATFFVNGLATLLFSLLRRQPLAFLWTIPGTILVGPALARYGLPPVIGAYLICSAILLLLGATRFLMHLERVVPMPVVMGMIAGVFLKFGLQLAHATVSAPASAGLMVAAFFLCMAWERRRGQAPLPPVLAALGVGVVTLPFVGFGLPPPPAEGVLAAVRPQTPVWDFGVILEVVLPLTVTVVFVQNAQGLAVLRSAGHVVTLRLVTLVSGVLSIVCGLLGSVPSTLAGPTNAILVSAGKPRGHYRGSLLLGLMSIVIGVFAPFFTVLMTTLPAPFVAALAGLALLGVIERALTASFGRLQTMGAMVSFLVSASQIEIAGVGSPFWGLLVGSVLSVALQEDR